MGFPHTPHIYHLQDPTRPPSPTPVTSSSMAHSQARAYKARVYL